MHSETTRHISVRLFRELFNTYYYKIIYTHCLHINDIIKRRSIILYFIYEIYTIYRMLLSKRIYSIPQREAITYIFKSCTAIICNETLTYMYKLKSYKVFFHSLTSTIPQVCIGTLVVSFVNSVVYNMRVA